MNQTLLHDSSSLGHGLDYAGPELVMAAVSLASQGWLVLAACGSIAQGDRKWPLLLLVTASTQSIATGRAFVICWILGKVSCLYDAFVTPRTCSSFRLRSGQLRRAVEVEPDAGAS